MTALAKLLAMLTHVRSMFLGNQMLRIAAGLVFAGVVDFMTFEDLTDVEQVRNPMDETCPVPTLADAPREVSVATFADVAAPDPAVADVLDLLHQPFVRRLHRRSHDGYKPQTSSAMTRILAE